MGFAHVLVCVCACVCVWRMCNNVCYVIIIIYVIFMCMYCVNMYLIAQIIFDSTGFKDYISCRNIYSRDFPKQEYWTGSHSLLRIFTTRGLSRSPALQAVSLP